MEGSIAALEVQHLFLLQTLFAFFHIYTRAHTLFHVFDNLFLVDGFTQPKTIKHMRRYALRSSEVSAYGEGGPLLHEGGQVLLTG
jgi:hypothetical protein